jgi:hypothetical protein
VVPFPVADVPEAEGFRVPLAFAVFYIVVTVAWRIARGA